MGKHQISVTVLNIYFKIGSKQGRLSEYMKREAVSRDAKRVLGLISLAQNIHPNGRSLKMTREVEV